MPATLAEATSHNVPPQVFLDHFRHIREAKSAQQLAAARVAQAKRDAKAAGIDLHAMRLLERFAELDADEADMRLRHMLTYARWASMPIGTQLDFLAGPDEREESIVEELPPRRRRGRPPGRRRSNGELSSTV